jgi:hypothetical protein
MNSKTITSTPATRSMGSKLTSTLVQPTSTDTPVPKVLFTLTATSTLLPYTQTPKLSTPTPVSELFEEKWESPNRVWSVIKTTWIKGHEFSVHLIVKSDWDKVEWVIEDAVYTDTPGEEFPSPVPFYWSINGRYLYFTHQTSGDGCYGGGKYRTEGLSRLDLSNGKISEVFPNFSSWMSISPDENYLAYFVYTKKGITLRKVSSGKEEVLEMLVQQKEGERLIDQSNIVWSPDGKSLLYTVLSGACDMPPYSTWLIRVNAANRTQKIIIENDPRGFIPISWVETNQVLVRDNDGQIWLFNLSNGEVKDP